MTSQDQSSQVPDELGGPNHEEIDPVVAELVVAIRDRFGLRGMRDAQVMLADEVALAERAMEGLGGEGSVEEQTIDS
jgi:hypothetical protein